MLRPCPEGKADLGNGTCGNCPSGQEIVNGVCLARCPDGTIREGDQCVPGCPEGQTMFAGGCVVADSCPEGELLKRRENSGYTCVSPDDCRDDDLLVQDDICVTRGACSNQGRVTYNGQCVEQCPEGAESAGIFCYDPCPDGEVARPDEGGTNQCVSREECLEDDFAVIDGGACAGWTFCRDTGASSSTASAWTSVLQVRNS